METSALRATWSMRHGNGPVSRFEIKDDEFNSALLFVLHERGQIDRRDSIVDMRTYYTLKEK
jgi:hypothetical protein